MEPKYKRILLKLSGEALAGDKKIGLDYDVITSFGKSIKKCVDAGVEVGNPFFSTDTAAALRAAEIEADIFFKATMVDGVYDKDPHKYPDAVKYDTLTFADILAKGLQVMDSTAAAMCKDNNIPILVFDLARPDNIYDACMGENIGTLVK